MKKKLETRKSAQFLLSLEGAGKLDSRSEIGTIVNISEWQSRPTVKFHCSCEQVRDHEELIPSHMIVTDEHLYILRLTDDRHKMVIRFRRVLKTIMKITRSAKMSDMVKIQYGTKGDDKVVHITDTDKLHIPGHGDEAVKAMKSSVLAAIPQRRMSCASGLTAAQPLFERRPSMVAEDCRHFLASDDELSLMKYRRNSTASYNRRRKTCAVTTMSTSNETDHV
ncbi:TBC1 domain family member 23-like [Watersipora subatra]|uniref:TBC1 domain family member 23-like n=1 Tax=Watersipora subatra TaxID=2589382 RepID=UPI00355BCA94